MIHKNIKDNILLPWQPRRGLERARGLEKSYELPNKWYLHLQEHYLYLCSLLPLMLSRFDCKLVSNPTHKVLFDYLPASFFSSSDTKMDRNTPSTSLLQSRQYHIISSNNTHIQAAVLCWKVVVISLLYFWESIWWTGTSLTNFKEAVE